MKCPFCGHDNDRVIDSRSGDDGYVIRRRRSCASCSRRFTTYERVAELNVFVIKKNGIREPFNSAKVRDGLQRACWKRPVTEEQLEEIISAVEHAVYSRFDAEIESSDLGEIVIEYLKDLDDVAYVRFASVYRQFNDVYDFVTELRPLLDRPRKRQ